MSCQTGPKREQRYLLVTDRSVLIVEPDLYRMDYAVVHYAASVLQIKSAVHNFDSCRLHMEARPQNPGCKGLPAASWNVVLVFKTPDEVRPSFRSSSPFSLRLSFTCHCLFAAFSLPFRCIFTAFSLPFR